MTRVKNPADSAALQRHSLEDPSCEARVAELVDRYCAAVRSGDAPSAESFIDQHPRYARPLRQCLDALALLQQTADRLDATTRCRGLDAGESLGDYVIEREIGRGSMGLVYLATQKTLDRPVALKVLSPSVTLDETYIKRFQREAMAAASLDHDHIVPVHHVGTIDSVHFYVMRWIDGCSMASANDHELLRRRPGNSRDRALARVMADAAGAIAAAHEMGIVHRDLKPSNLLLDKKGKVWVSDFGLARVGLSSELTCSGDLVGTLRYMSPEQAAGRTDQVDDDDDADSLGETPAIAAVTADRVFSQWDVDVHPAAQPQSTILPKPPTTDGRAEDDSGASSGLPGREDPLFAGI